MTKQEKQNLNTMDEKLLQELRDAGFEGDCGISELIKACSSDLIEIRHHLSGEWVVTTYEWSDYKLVPSSMVYTDTSLEEALVRLWIGNK